MTKSDAAARDAATAVAQSDPARAEDLAQRVENPYYRAQALAWAARYAPAPRVLPLARLAMDAAGDCDDAFRQATASAWTIRALLERDRRDDALMMLEIALGAVPRIEPASSRAEALILLFQAAFDTDETIRRSMLFALIELADRDDHWRIERAVVSALAMAHAVDPDYATKLANGLGDKTRAKWTKALASSDTAPRDFFW